MDQNTNSLSSPSMASSSSSAPAPSPPPTATRSGQGPPEPNPPDVGSDQVPKQGEVEEAECDSCLFMEGGGCKDQFIAWENCVEEAEKNKDDVEEKCFEVTSLLEKCVDAYVDYLGPRLSFSPNFFESDAAVDRNPQSPSSPSMASSSTSSSSAPQHLDPNIEPPSSPLTVTGFNQDPPEPNPPDIGSDKDPKQGEVVEEEEEEEEAECGFCLFMKGGGCKDQFIAWENCVEEAEKNKDDVAEKCFEVTSLLKKCMDAHADYYEPILRAEQAMSDSVAEEAAKESVVVEETIIEVVSEKNTGAEDSKAEN